MLDPTPARNLKSFGAKAASRLTRSKGAWRRISSAAVFMAIFAAAAAIWSAGHWLLSRRDAPVPFVTDVGDKARLARIDGAVKEILARPLFNADRTPPPPPPTPEQLAAAQRPVLKSHLTGITILTDSRLALFSGDGKNYISVKEGDEIDGLKVQRIEADRVILVSPFSEQILQPSKGLAPTVRNTKPLDLGSVDPDKP